MYHVLISSNPDVRLLSIHIVKNLKVKLTPTIFKADSTRQKQIEFKLNLNLYSEFSMCCQGNFDL